MNRADLQQLAEARIRDARVLLASGRHAGAYYFAGYSIECALKACIALRTKEHDFPDIRAVRASYTHDIAALLGIAGLRPELESHAMADARFEKHWKAVVVWSEQSRYLGTVTPDEAIRLVSAIDDPAAGYPPMDEEILVKEVLGDDMIRNGAALVAHLDGMGFPVSSAFWLYTIENNRWSLVIATPYYAEVGSSEAVGVVQQALKDTPQVGERLYLRDMRVAAATYLPAALLRKVFNTGMVIIQKRFTYNAIDGHLIDDALIYRSTDIPPSR